RLHAFFAFEQHFSEQTANVWLGGQRVEVVQPVADCGAVPDPLAVILREVAAAPLMGPGDGAFVRLEAVRKQLAERGLTHAALADDGDLFAFGDDGRKVLAHGDVGPTLGQLLDRHGLLARRLLDQELNERTLDVGALQIGQLEALDLLLAALHLRRARAGGEAGHEVLQLCDFLLPLRVLLLDLAAHLALGDDHVVVATGVGDDGFVVDVGNVRANLVQEVTIVRNGDEYAAVVAQELLEPTDAVDV